MHTLLSPIKARRNNADHTITELDIPEVVTVGMMRKVEPSTNELLQALNLTAVLAGLDPISASKLETQDAIAYVETITTLGLITANDVAGFDVPVIKPLRAALQKVTASISNSLEFSAQVLEAAGMKRSEIDAMDFRDFAPAIPKITEAFISPKKQ